MATAEEREKAAKATQERAAQETQKAKEIQKNIENRYGRAESTRGYNWSSTTGNVIQGSSPQTGPYSYDPRTQQAQNLPNDAAQKIESQAIKTQIVGDIQQQIKAAEEARAKNMAEYTEKIKTTGLSSAEQRDVAARNRELNATISDLKSQASSLKEKGGGRAQYSGVMTTSGKIYESAAEAKRQGATVLKDRKGRDVTFEGDIRSTAGFGQSNRGYGDPLLKTGKVPVQANYSSPGYTQSETGFPKVTNDNIILNRNGTGKPNDPFRSKDPEESRLTGFANPVWTVNTPSGKMTFQDKKDLEAYVKSGGKIIESKEAASPYNDNFITRKFVSVPQQETYVPNKQATAYSIDLQESLGGKEESVYLPAGSLQPKTEFNKLIEGGIKSLSDIQTGMRQGVKEKNIFSIISEPIVKPLAELGRSGLSSVAFVVNTSEQVIDPWLAKNTPFLFIKPPSTEPRNAPITLGDDTASITQIPINSEKLNILDPSTYSSSLQNPFEKEYQSKQAKYIEKFGVSSYIAGAGENVFAVLSGVGLIKSGITGTGLVLKSISQQGIKAISPTLGKAAKSAAITNTPSSIFKGQSKFASPSSNWDLVEKVSPVGFRKNINKPNSLLPERQTGKPVPNPFGKEREPFYTMSLTAENVIKKGKKLVQDIPQAIDILTPIEIIGIGKAVKADVKLIAQKTKSGLRGTADYFNEWNKSPIVSSIPEGYRQKNTRLERMKNLMWPDEPILPPKPKSTSTPTGYKTRLSARMYIENTKKNIKDNLQVLNDIDKDVTSKITNPILAAIRKDQKTPNRSINRINFGRKKQTPDLEDETPKFIIKTKTSAKVNLFKTKEKIKQQKKELGKTGGIMRDLFYPQEPKKEIVPYFTEQGLKNITREDSSTIITDFFRRQKAKERPPNLRVEFPVKTKRDYSITPKPHQKYLQGEELSDKLQRQQRKNIEKRRSVGIVNLPERELIPRLKYQSSSIMEKIAGDVKPAPETKTEYMPRKRSTSKPGKNIFIEDRAKETQDFLDSLKSEKTGSKEFKEEFKDNPPVLGLDPKYFNKPQVSKARILDLTKEPKFKEPRNTPIEKLKSSESKGIKDFVKEGEKRKQKVDLLRSEKKLELSDRPVSIFKVPYKETELDKMLAALGKKQKTYYKKSTYKSEETPSQKDFKGDPLKKRWRDETRKDVGSGRQIVITEPPKTKTKLTEPTPETVINIAGEGGQKKPSNNKPIIVPPLPKEQKKKRETESVYLAYETLHANRPQISARSLSSLGSRTGISIKQITPQRERLGIKSELRSSQSLKSPQKEKFLEKQRLKTFEALKQPQKLKERQKTRTPEINKPMTKQSTKPKFKETVKPMLKFPEILVPPPKLLFAAPPIKPSKPKGVKSKRGRKGVDFLANSLTYDIQGLVRRDDVVYGDKRTARLLKADKKRKFSQSFGLGFSNKKKLKI